VAIALLQKRGFKEEDFAQFHPGGALGRRLLFKVRDLMHQGDALPRVPATAPVREAIREMTSKKLGMTTVVNAKGQLAGVITDGDLRRFIEKGNSLAKARAKDLSTKSPRTIQADALAAKALQTMEQFSITSLVVVDDRNRLAGVVHLHDLLKHGVA
jgi:arabinose-5-phosphate isomerase